MFISQNCLTFPHFRCFFICLVRTSLRLNLKPHIVHSKAFSPVCVVAWRRYALISHNFRPHTSHSYLFWRATDWSHGMLVSICPSGSIKKVCKRSRLKVRFCLLILTHFSIKKDLCSWTRITCCSVVHCMSTSHTSVLKMIQYQ